METESQFVAIIRVWAAMAWADGIIAEAEAIGLRRLIERTNALTEEERQTALGFLDNRVELDAARLAELNPELRKGVYRAAVRLAAIDQHIADSERTLLLRLREALALDEATARELESSVPLFQQTQAPA